MVGAVTPGAARLIEATEYRVVVSWAGDGEPITLTLYSDGGEVVVRLTPIRAIELAQELLTAGVQAIKADWPG